MTQFHFDAESYLSVVRAELPRYNELQQAIAVALPDGVTRVLDLGAGTGATSLAVLSRFPSASVLLVDESPQMLAVATATLPADRVESIVVGDMVDALPDGTFDAVVSALAIHHLDPARKQLLFSRLRGIVAARGRFVMADVIIPDDPADAVTPLSPEFDRPGRVADLLAWLDHAGFDASCPWAWKDLAVIVGE